MTTHIAKINGIHTHKEFISALNNQVIRAGWCKVQFDSLWELYPSKRTKGYFFFYLRETVLLNCFDNIIALFCSRQLWSSGGLGAHAVEFEVLGPLLLMSNGDQLKRMELLLNCYRKEMVKMMSMFTKLEEKTFFENELKNIKNVVDSTLDSIDLFKRSI